MIPTARSVRTHPPTGTPSRAIIPSEGLPIPHIIIKEWPGRSSIARVERRSSLGLCEQEGHLAAPGTFLSCAFREQEDGQATLPAYFQHPARAPPREFDLIYRNQSGPFGAESIESARCPW